MHIGDVVENLIISYFVQAEKKPSMFEVMAVKNALPFAEAFDEKTYQSYRDWVDRHLDELKD